MIDFQVFDSREVWHKAIIDSAKSLGWSAVRIRSKAQIKPGRFGFIRPHPAHLAAHRELDAVMRGQLTMVQDRTQVEVYDNKLAQFRLWPTLLPDTWYFTNAAQALANDWTFPLVSKAKEGASSYNVRILKNRAALERHIAQVFGPGVPVNLCADGKAVTQRDYILLQRFIPHEITYRVNILGPLRRAIFERFNYPDRPVAQTGNVRPVHKFTSEHYDLIKYADEVATIIGTNWCALDILRDNGKWTLLETSLAWPWKQNEHSDTPLIGGGTWGNIWLHLCGDLDAGYFESTSHQTSSSALSFPAHIHEKRSVAGREECYGKAAETKESSPLSVSPSLTESTGGTKTIAENLITKNGNVIESCTTKTIDSVVVWKWNQDKYRSTFTAAHVNAVQQMVARFYRRPHRFICLTDDPQGLNENVEHFPLPQQFSDLENPTWGKEGPSCYRRLFAFSKEFEQIAGKRFVMLDLDVIITDRLEPLWDRPEDFIILEAPQVNKQRYNGSMMLMTAGAREKVWKAFDPIRSPGITKAAGLRGTDQAWIQFVTGNKESVWNTKDGVYAYRTHCSPSGKLPRDARMVVFWGKPDPWDEITRTKSPWVKRFYPIDMETNFAELIGKHQGKRICVMGGAKTLEEDLEQVEADIYIAVNEHGANLRPINYFLAMDDIHCATGKKMRPYLKSFANAPIISPWNDANYQMMWWPGHPRRMFSGLIAAWAAFVMGGHPTILAGFSGYHGERNEQKSRQWAKLVAEYTPGQVRVVGGREVNEKWTPYQRSETLNGYTQHQIVRGLLGIEEPIRIQVVKSCLIHNQQQEPGTELLVARHEVRRQLKHRMVLEV